MLLDKALSDFEGSLNRPASIMVFGEDAYREMDKIDKSLTLGRYLPFSNTVVLIASLFDKDKDKDKDIDIDDEVLRTLLEEFIHANTTRVCVDSHVRTGFMINPDFYFKENTKKPIVSVDLESNEIPNNILGIRDAENIEVVPFD